VACRSDRHESSGGGPLIHGGGHRGSPGRVWSPDLNQDRGPHDDRRDDEPSHAAGEELGCRFAARDGGFCRAAPNGVHLWADRFDGSLEDVFELPDRMASSVAGVIEPALQAAEIARATNRPAPGAS
jgi:hypothetical protein